jgi:transposase-like protein
MAVERMKTCDNVSALAKELGVDRSVLYHWRNLTPGQGGDESGKSPVRELRKEIRELKRVLAEKTLEIDFFQRCLAKNRGSTPERQRLWRDGIYDQIREVMSMQGSLKVERMCELARVSRAGRVSLCTWR